MSSRAEKVLLALRRLTLLALFAFFAGVNPSSLQAQAVAGLTGTVTDSLGAVVPQAKVAIKNIDTGVANSAITSSVGTYAVSGLLPGRYQIKVDAKGFKSSVTNNVQLDIGKQSTINITVAVGNVNETVEVQSDAIALDTTSPQLGTTIEPELIKALPIEVAGRGRQIDQLQFLAPGVQGGSFVHEVSGGVYFQQEVIVNGIPLPQAETEGMTTNVNPPYELVREFRVERTTFAAQYGLAQGAVNYQTASGTNKFHGDLFEINRNSSFDSKGFFNTVVPADHENNYGFTVEGPVRIPHLYDGRNRTFFHATAEWYGQQVGVTGLATVPTAQERTGDFSDFVDAQSGALIPIYDPTTGQQFQDGGRLNVIPQSRLSALSKGYLQYLPAPDRTGQGIGGLTSNKNPVDAANTVNQTNWGFTVDHSLTKNQTFHYAEWRNLYNNLDAESSLAAPTNPVGEWTKGYILGTGFLLNYVNTVTPHLVVTAGVGWLGEINNTLPTNNYSFPGVQNGVTAPEVIFSGGQNVPTSWSTSGSIQASINRKLGVSFVNNWLWTRGRHTINMGGEARRELQDTSGSAAGGGAFTFAYRTTAQPGDFSGNSGSSFASFLLGGVDSASRSFSAEIRLRNFDFSPYIQDDIKFSPRLTVNVGLRWDIAVPFTGANNNLVYLDVNSANPAAGGLPGLPVTLGNCGAQCGGFARASIQWHHFGPRLGAAYLLTPKTVLQAGFALAYLKGGAYSFGDSGAASAFSSLLAGQFTRSSIGGNVPAYGSWDTQQLPQPASTPITPGLGLGNSISPFSADDGYLPYTEQWNFNIQRQLPFDTFITIAYVGNREVHIMSNLNNPNQSNPSIGSLGSKLSDSFATGQAQADGFQLPYANFVSNFGGSATVAQALRPFPQYTTVTDHFEHSGTVAYNGLQVQGEKRFSSGLSFLTSLTVARTMSNGDGGNAAFSGQAVNKYNQKAEWSVASSDQKYNYKFSGTYQLPFGHGKRFLNSNRLVDAAIGGFQFGGILDYEGGGPTSFGENSAIGNLPGFSGNRPNRISSVPLKGASYSQLLPYILGKAPAPRIFDANAFQASGDYEIGNASRNYSSVRGVGTRNENLNLAKHFALFDGANLTVQFDWFNAFNRAILTGLNTNASIPAQFGLAQIISQNNANRQGQISARIEF
jgi:hypothetical protein